MIHITIIHDNMISTMNLPSNKILRAYKMILAEIIKRNIIYGEIFLQIYK